MENFVLLQTIKSNYENNLNSKVKEIFEQLEKLRHEIEKTMKNIDVDLSIAPNSVYRAIKKNAV